MKQEELRGLTQKIEAILFLENKYVRKKEISEKVTCTEEELELAIKDLNARYEAHSHAFCVEQHENSLILVVKRSKITDIVQYYVEDKKEGLTRTLLETLAIIAYSQPITKSEINSIRGVNTNNAVNQLLLKKLIRVAGQKAVPGTPHQYITTPEFLKLCQLSSIEELPVLNERDRQLFENTTKSSSLVSKEKQAMASQTERNKPLQAE